MKRKLKQVYIVLLCLLYLISSVGCDRTAQVSVPEDKKIKISICWPEKGTAVYDQYEEWLLLYNEKFPDVEVTRDFWQFTTDSFPAKVASGTLPTLYNAPYTEALRLVSGNYVADITEQMAEYGYTEHLSDEILDIITVDGRQYFIPVAVYLQGIYLNNDLFKEAGLIDENGAAIIPETYEELGEMAGLIKEKTGQAGFIMPTMNKIGGWHFMNIAWSFGTEFMKYEDGKWIATFGDEHGVAALRFVKDLKWKYNALSDDMSIDTGKMYDMFSSGKGAMYFGGVRRDAFLVYKTQYNMDKDMFTIGSVPEGPGGRHALLGGNINCIAPSATDEQKKAVFEWLKLIGYGAQMTEEFKKSTESSFIALKKQDCAIGVPEYSMWKSGEQSDYYDSLMEKYRNIDKSRYEHYAAREGVEIHTEEPVNCQELYEILDNCIQTVLRNEDADCRELMENAEKEFQINYLNVVE